MDKKKLKVIGPDGTAPAQVPTAAGRISGPGGTAPAKVPAAAGRISGPGGTAPTQAPTAAGRISGPGGTAPTSKPTAAGRISGPGGTAPASQGFNASDYMTKLKSAAGAPASAGIISGPGGTAPTKTPAKPVVTPVGPGGTAPGTSSVSEWYSQDFTYDPYKGAQYSYDPYKSQYQNEIASTLDAIRNGGKFEYDAETDPMYQQYADMYTRNGQDAMQSTLAELAARTGGVASSYAASAGNQAYNTYMQQLADRIPELRNQAYNEWRDNLNNQYNYLSTLQGMDDSAYNRYNSDRGFGYNVFSDQEDRNYDQWKTGLGYQNQNWQRRVEEAARDRERGWDVEDRDLQHQWNVEDRDLSHQWDLEDRDLRHQWDLEDRDLRREWDLADADRNRGWDVEDRDLQREWSLADAERNRGWDVEDRDLQREWALADAERNRAWDVEDRNLQRQWSVEDRNYAAAHRSSGGGGGGYSQQLQQAAQDSLYRQGAAVAQVEAIRAMQDGYSFEDALDYINHVVPEGAEREQAIRKIQLWYQQNMQEPAQSAPVRKPGGGNGRVMITR